MAAPKAKRAGAAPIISNSTDSKIYKKMEDIKKEIRSAELWESQEDSKEVMTIQTITLMAQRGLTYCEGYCASREHAGEHRCRCIRERFPTPAHYDLYLLNRETYKELLTLATIGLALAEDGDKNK